MNLNEECLLQFLNNPDRLDNTTKKLSNYILLKNTKISNIESIRKNLNVVNGK